jgi:hypothetical protein
MEPVYCGCGQGRGGGGDVGARRERRRCVSWGRQGNAIVAVMLIWGYEAET